MYRESDARARRAALRLVLSAALFALMALGTRVVAKRIPGPETAAVRFGVGVALVLAAWAGGRIAIRPRRWGWLIARGLFGGIAVLGYFASLERIPVGLAVLLNQTHPVFAMLAAWVLIGERPTRRALAAVPLTLIGMALIVGLRFDQVHLSSGELMGIGAAISAGIAVTSIRAVLRHGEARAEDAWTVFFSFTGVGLLVTVPAVLPPLGTWVSPTPLDWALLLAIAGVSVAAQLIMTEALRHVAIAPAGVISQLTVVFSIVLGAVVLSEPLTPGFAIGAALTASGAALAAAGTRRRPAPPVT